MKRTALFCFLFFTVLLLRAQDELPLRGLAIAAPDKENVELFVKFINEELAPRKINTLVLRVIQFLQHVECFLNEEVFLIGIVILK